MIARIWHGKTGAGKADAYEAFLLERAIPDYRSVPGNLSATVLRRDEGEVSHFITLSLWKDIASIRTFAGDEYEVAKYYPEDAGFLLEFEPAVVHYRVAGSDSLSGFM